MHIDRTLMLFLVFFMSVYVFFAFTPSHYSAGLNQLGVESRPLLGSARAIRSDEWIVLTPYFQIAVKGAFSVVDTISPYHQPLKAFQPVPIQDWSLLFKPQLWAFWIMPASNAFSMYYAILAGSFVIGYTIFLRQLGVRPSVAALGSIVLFFSHLVQVWWTSNAASFAFAPWAAIAFLLTIHPFFKALLIFYGSALWVFGNAYPPFLISGALSLAVLILAFRPEAISLKNVLSAFIGLALMVTSFFLYFGDLIAVMQATVYPGARSSSGGDVIWSRMAAHLAPFLTTTSDLQSLIPESNDCEIAVVSTLLPFAIISFADWKNVRNLPITSFIVVTVGLLLILAWLVIPVPAFPIIDMVPANRMVWGFGLLFTLSALIACSLMNFVITLERVSIYILLIIISFIISEVWMASTINGVAPPSNVWEGIRTGWSDLVPVPVLIMAALAVRLWKLPERTALVATCAISGMLTFGTFNPVQQAYDIFSVPESKLQNDFREMARRSPNGWVAVEGLYGALINGVGIPSINHTLYSPQLLFFKKIFSEMSSKEFDIVFNRYAHIMPAQIDTPLVPQADIISIPIERVR